MAHYKHGFGEILQAIDQGIDLHKGEAARFGDKFPRERAYHRGQYDGLEYIRRFVIKAAEKSVEESDT